ncbi:MAG: hypothetical protein ACLPWS_06690 [Rhodomicrobium sp.]
MIAVLTAIGAWFARQLAVSRLTSLASFALLGPLGSIATGIAGAIGAIVTAAFEIVAALARSAEGRVILAIAALGLSFLYLRFHYTEEGKAEARANFAALQRPCHAMGAERRKR